MPLKRSSSVHLPRPLKFKQGKQAPLEWFLSESYGLRRLSRDQNPACLFRVYRGISWYFISIFFGVVVFKSEREVGSLLIGKHTWHFCSKHQLFPKRSLVVRFAVILRVTPAPLVLLLPHTCARLSDSNLAAMAGLRRPNIQKVQPQNQGPPNYVLETPALTEKKKSLPLKIDYFHFGRPNFQGRTVSFREDNFSWTLCLIKIALLCGALIGYDWITCEQ